MVLLPKDEEDAKTAQKARHDSRRKGFGHPEVARHQGPAADQRRGRGSKPAVERESGIAQEN